MINYTHAKRNNSNVIIWNSCRLVGVLQCLVFVIYTVLSLPSLRYSQTDSFKTISLWNWMPFMLEFLCVGNSISYLSMRFIPLDDYNVLYYIWFNMYYKKISQLHLYLETLSILFKNLFPPFLRLFSFLDIFELLNSSPSFFYRHLIS